MVQKVILSNQLVTLHSRHQPQVIISVQFHLLQLFFYASTLKTSNLTLNFERSQSLNRNKKRRLMNCNYLATNSFFFFQDVNDDDDNFASRL